MRLGSQHLSFRPHLVNQPWRLPKRMTSNTLNEEKNKDFDSTVNYSEWTTKAQPPESSHVTNNRIPLEKKEIE